MLCYNQNKKPMIVTLGQQQPNSLFRN